MAGTAVTELECARDGCTSTFVPKNAQHGFCSPKCRRAARGAGWRFVREAALRRDKDTCQDCAAEDCPLEVHHIIALCKGGSNKLTNLVSLCRGCHKARHKSWEVPQVVEELVEAIGSALRPKQGRRCTHAA
jgi:5-methylcytosine-specific restriction endonuclease McrA